MAPSSPARYAEPAPASVTERYGLQRYLIEGLGLSRATRGRRRFAACRRESAGLRCGTTWTFAPTLPRPWIHPPRSVSTIRSPASRRVRHALRRPVPVASAHLDCNRVPQSSRWWTSSASTSRRSTTPRWQRRSPGTRCPDGAGDRPLLRRPTPGNQFGGFSPQLGDGRALVLGEVIDRQGRRRDIAFKGSGRIAVRPSGGDGKAAVGTDAFAEVLIGEAMHALGIGPRHPRPRGRGDGRAGLPRADAARRRADARGGEPHPRRDLRVPLRARRRRARAQTRRVHDRAARPRARDLAAAVAGAAAGRGRAPGGPDRAMDERGLHPRRDEHRSATWRSRAKRSDRLGDERAPSSRRTTPTRCSAPSTTRDVTRSATSPTSRCGTSRAWPKRCCRCSPTIRRRRWRWPPRSSLHSLRSTADTCSADIAPSSAVRRGEQDDDAADTALARTG